MDLLSRQAPGPGSPPARGPAGPRAPLPPWPWRTWAPSRWPSDWKSPTLPSAPACWSVQSRLWSAFRDVASRHQGMLRALAYQSDLDRITRDTLRRRLAIAVARLGNPSTAPEPDAAPRALAPDLPWRDLEAGIVGPLVRARRRVVHNGFSPLNLMPRPDGTADGHRLGDAGGGGAGAGRGGPAHVSRIPTLGKRHCENQVEPCSPTSRMQRRIDHRVLGRRGGAQPDLRRHRRGAAGPPAGRVGNGPCVDLCGATAVVSPRTRRRHRASRSGRRRRDGASATRWQSLNG